MESLDGPRASRAEEFPEIMRMLDEVFWVSAGKPPCMERLYPWLNRAENHGHFFIFRNDECIVSHVSINLLDVFCGIGRIRIGLVGGVATLPEYRGRGLASGLLSAAMAHMRTDGCDIAVLWATGKALYERAGFYECGISYKAVLEQRAIAAMDCAGGQVMPYCRSKEHTPGMLKLHEDGPAPSIRPPDEFAEHIEYDFGTTRLLVRDGRCAAYLSTRALFGGEPYISEWAGEPADVLTLAKSRLTELGLDRMSISLPAWETPLSKALRRAGVRLEVALLHGPCMICVLSPGLWERAAEKGLGGERVKDMLSGSGSRAPGDIAAAQVCLFGESGCMGIGTAVMPFYIWRPDVI